MSCYSFCHDNTYGGSAYVSGTTCDGVLSAITLTNGECACIETTDPHTCCGPLIFSAICSPSIITPTPTSTITTTPTNTPTITPTPSITATNTPTPSITATNTSTPFSTPTNTTTATVTPSNSPTPSITPSNTATQTITPTNTPSPSVTPSQTPNSVCPEEFVITNSTTNRIDNGTYTRATVTGSTSFQYGYYVWDGSPPNSYYVLGTAPDGYDYPIYQVFNNNDWNTFARMFSTTNVDRGWSCMEQFANPLSGGTIAGASVYGELQYVQIGNVRYPKSGLNTFSQPTPIFSGTCYITYTFVCPTPTPTISSTPTMTTTPTNTSTPSITPSNTATPTNTPSVTTTQTSSPTNTPTTTPQSTSTPTITPTMTTTPTITPTNTNTPSPTPTSGATGCLCYTILNETGSPINYQWDDCVLGASTASLGGGANVQVCAVDLPLVDPGGTITPCTSVTNCNESSDCTGCS